MLVSTDVDINFKHMFKVFFLSRLVSSSGHRHDSLSVFLLLLLFVFFSLIFILRKKKTRSSHRHPLTLSAFIRLLAITRRRFLGKKA